MKFECRDGPKKDRYKTANKNVNRLTFVFEHVNKYTMETGSKTNVFEWYNLQRNSSGKKRSKHCNLIDHFFVLIHNIIIYYVYECFGQYFVS